MQFYIGKKYRIVCTNQEPSWASPLCARIVNVGVSEGADNWSIRLTVDQVVNYISQGVIFYTYGPTSGKVALVERYYCNTCRKYHIRSHADCTTDNNLDYLGTCSLKAA